MKLANDASDDSVVCSNYKYFKTSLIVYCDEGYHLTNDVVIYGTVSFPEQKHPGYDTRNVIFLDKNNFTEIRLNITYAQNCSKNAFYALTGHSGKLSVTSSVLELDMTVEGAYLYTLAQYTWGMTFLDSKLTISTRKGQYVAGLCEYVRDSIVFNYTDLNMQVSGPGNVSCFAMYWEKTPIDTFATI